MHSIKSNGKPFAARSIEKKNARPSPSNQADSLPATHTRNLPPRDPLREQEVDFAEFEDGTLVEIVEDPSDPNRTLLAVFKKGRVRLTDRLAHAGQILVPMPRYSPVFADVKLPRGIMTYGSVFVLWCTILSFIRYAIDVPNEYAVVLAAFIVYTWVADHLPTAVYLSVIGLPQSGKTTLLELLSLLCRRPLLVSDISEAAMSEACSDFSPTLLIDEVDWHSPRTKSALRQLLRAGTSRSARILRVGKSTSSFGPKVFSSLEPSSDPALNSRCVQIPMAETNKHTLVRLGDPYMVKLAGEIQQQLLRFRLNHCRSIRPAVIPGAEELRPRSRDILGNLGAALPKNRMLNRALLAIFKAIHDPSTQESLGPRQQALLAAIFRLTHLYPLLRSVRVGGEAGLAFLANSFLLDAGERLMLTDKAAGILLAAMGFYHKQRTKNGWILWLDSSASDRCHQLVKTHGRGSISETDFERYAQSCAVCQSKKF